MADEATHVDDWVMDHKNDDYARWMLMHMRLPAVLRSLSNKFLGDAKLFCNWGTQRYRVTGASRLGDVWLAEDHDQECGYDYRVNIDECSKWGAEP